MGMAERERQYRNDSIGLPWPEEVYLDEQFEMLQRLPQAAPEHPRGQTAESRGQVKLRRSEPTRQLVRPAGGKES